MPLKKLASKLRLGADTSFNDTIGVASRTEKHTGHACLANGPGRQPSELDAARRQNLVDLQRSILEECVPIEEERKPLMARLKDRRKVLARTARRVDNFTIWDNETTTDPLDDILSRPKQFRHERPSFQRAAPVDLTAPLVGRYGLKVLSALPRRDTASTVSSIQSQQDQSDAAHPRAAQALTIGEIDWSKVDEAQVKSFCRSFGNKGSHEPQTEADVPSEPSPTDSALSFGRYEPPYQGKGKGRARDYDVPGAWIEPVGDRHKLAAPHVQILANRMIRCSTASSTSSGDGGIGLEQAQGERQDGENGTLDDIVEQEAHLRKEMSRLQNFWQERLRKLELRKEAELQILQQQQEEEHRQLQDSIRLAQELETEEKRQCLEREEKERAEAAELQARIEEEERLAAALAAMRDCVVCGDSKSPLDFAVSPPTATCEHAIQTCLECTSTWVSAEFASKGGEALKCPECPQLLTYTDVQRAAPAATFAAYEKLLTRNALAQIPEFAWCLAPGCDAGQLNEDNNGAFMECYACGYKQCLTHKCAWHKGETCKQYDYRSSGAQRRDEERATEAVLDEISKKCPGKNCGWRIQKTDGCDHMTCRKCRHEFCWQCLASHADIKKVGNTAHQRTCKFHSENLTASWPFNVH